MTMDNKFWECWDIFNRNMKVGVHRTTGITQERDVRTVMFWLKWHEYEVRNRTILNIGLGDSTEARIFKKAKMDVYGISNSEEEAEEARRYKVKAWKMDAHQLSFDNDMFDYIYMRDTMEHFIAPIVVFTQFRRVIRMGGLLMFHYPFIDETHDWTHWFVESPRIIYDWLIKFGFRLLLFRYEPFSSSDYLYIAQKVEIPVEELERGANVTDDMVNELTKFREKLAYEKKVGGG